MRPALRPVVATDRTLRHLHADVKPCRSEHVSGRSQRRSPGLSGACWPVPSVAWREAASGQRARRARVARAAWAGVGWGVTPGTREPAPPRLTGRDRATVSGSSAPRERGQGDWDEGPTDVVRGPVRIGHGRLGVVVGNIDVDQRLLIDLDVALVAINDHSGREHLPALDQRRHQLQKRPAWFNREDGPHACRRCINVHDGDYGYLEVELQREVTSEHACGDVVPALIDDDELDDSRLGQHTTPERHAELVARMRIRPHTGKALNERSVGSHPPVEPTLGVGRTKRRPGAKHSDENADKGRDDDRPNVDVLPPLPRDHEHAWKLQHFRSSRSGLGQHGPWSGA
ncbi:hypothetical protein CPT_Spernnie_078 [Streptomyces phage Spernnie]|uniref:Uncharacterized protein n=1 Tax=Streptomyces phage Spernnie TaxID=2767588 RepID=A0A873WL27_9CAUD|nr:hypothetical protein KGG74_gp78 [Streptomyces phage Spernnie]QPB09682.1 hypothetical protein CPT_Spernnie_078 [Streptomyces phage Spernnie]